MYAPGMRTAGLFVVSLLALALVGGAPPVPDPSPPDATVDDLSWLVGRWVSSSDEAIVTETWMEPIGGVMFGVNATEKGGALAAFETLRVAPVEGVLTYLASPEGRHPPTAFRITEVEPGHVRFANPAHDFPQWIDYRRSDGVLTASIGAGEGTMSWRFVLDPPKQ